MLQRILATVALALAMSHPAAAQLSAESYIEDLKEMQRLVEPGESRSVLFCIEISGKIGMQEARRSLLAQTERYTQNGNALMLSLAYVSGAFEKDWKAINDGNGSVEVMAALFQETCTPLLLR